MWLVDALRERLRGLFGGGESTDEQRTGTASGASKAETEGATGPAFECAVCGTAVEDPEGPCPLCRGTEVVAAGSEVGADDDSGTDETVRVETDDEATDRLRELRSDDPLVAHADRWEARAGGDYRVELPDGVEYVETQEAVRELLDD